MTSPQRPSDRAPWSQEAAPEGPRSARDVSYTSSAPVSAFMPSFDAAPPSAPPSTKAPRRSQGGISAVVRQIDRKHGSFFISRLILMTGINLRTYDAATHDDPQAVAKLAKALRALVPTTELDGLLQLLSIQR